MGPRTGRDATGKRKATKPTDTCVPHSDEKPLTFYRKGTWYFILLQTLGKVQIYIETHVTRNVIPFTEQMLKQRFRIAVSKENN